MKIKLVIVDTEALNDAERAALLTLLALTGRLPAAAPRKRAVKTEEPEPEGPTLEDAVARATELVSEGKTDFVKAEIAKLGFKRVTELKTVEDIAKFMAAVS